MHLDRLSIWRDHDAGALQLGEFMRLGPVELALDADLLAKNVLDAGGRLVVVDEVIDLDALEPTDAARFLALLRELTSYGISVEWRLKTGPSDARWRDLCHLFPPSQVLTPAGTATPAWEFWRQQFSYGLCVMRRGPGIVEVRDRRAGKIRCLRFTSPLHLAAIERLERGAQASSFAPEALAELESARVVMAVGRLRLWLPCRLRRSPLSPVVFW